ncbi:MAG: DUF3524 domain-containing protein [Pseudomonadota bacterium]
MHVLLLSAYDALSHRYWREGMVDALSAHTRDHTFSVHTLPPRYFSWRFRGNPLTWSGIDFTVDEPPFDLLVTTSMTDLSALKGLNPSVRNLPTLLYVHENQFAYPKRSAPDHELERQVTSLYSTLAADRVLFNSAFNRDTFMEGADNLLRRLPDQVPKDIIPRIERKMDLLPVPLQDECFLPDTSASTDRLTLVWNHRWESDKGMDRLLCFVEALDQIESPITVHILGQSGNRIPHDMVKVQSALKDRGQLGEFGFVENRTQYLRLLQSSHIVVSTSEHDFQGLSILEAMACGCRPLVPDRLAYPEFLGSQYRYSGHEDHPIEARSAVMLLSRWIDELPPPQVPDDLRWQQLGSCYVDAFAKSIQTSKEQSR